ncbi:DUF805 domain-containing protein [Jiella marina]|uniref:DUF805 domain-containing protein n=1 Tax=Jiella sp. LLJ827 TaxID=2917712 RepID=UPI002101860B|nr:DUF805 domain-containing protein [Jiella sp. LLJ827]
MSRFFSFKGRIGRTTWWLAFLLSFLLLSCGFLMVGMAGGTAASAPVAIFGTVLILLNIWIGWATLVTRLHDMDHSGFFALLMFVPIVGFVLIALCAFKSGTMGMNRFGMPGGSDRSSSLGEAFDAFDVGQDDRFAAKIVPRPAKRSPSTNGRSLRPAPSSYQPKSSTGRGLPRQSFGRRGFSAS